MRRLAPSPSPSSQDSRLPKKWDMPRLYILAGVMCVVVTLLQLLYLGMGFAAMRPHDEQVITPPLPSPRHPPNLSGWCALPRVLLTVVCPLRTTRSPTG